MKRRKLLLGVLASTAGIALTPISADAKEEKPSVAQDKPKPKPNPKPCTWTTGNSKPPPCKD